MPRKGEVLLGLDPGGRQRLADGARPVLVEGALDVEAFKILTLDVVPVAVCGTAVTKAQLSELRDATPGGLATLAVAFDPDTAGRAAAVWVWSMLPAQEAATARAVVLPEGADLAQLVQDHRSDELRAAASSPVPLTHLMVDQVLAGADLEHAGGRVAAVRTVARSVARLPTSAVAQTTGYLTTRLGDQDTGLMVLDEMIGAHLEHEPPAGDPAITHEVDQFEVATVPGTRAVGVDEEVYAWVSAHASLIAVRLDALVGDVEHNRPAWARTLTGTPADPVEAERWRTQVRHIVAYRDRYEIDDVDEPITQAPARGVKELARADARAAYESVRSTEDALMAGGEGEIARGQRRTTTTTHVQEILRRTGQIQPHRDVEALTERVRRLREQNQPPQPQAGKRTPSPQAGGPQM